MTSYYIIGPAWARTERNLVHMDSEYQQSRGAGGCGLFRSLISYGVCQVVVTGCLDDRVPGGSLVRYWTLWVDVTRGLVPVNVCVYWSCVLVGVCPV